MNTSMKKIFFMLVGCAAAATLGVAALFGVIAPTPGASLQPSASATASRITPTHVAATPSTTTPTATSAATVTLALTSLDRQPSQGGVTTTIVIANHQSSALSFSFDPSYDLKLVDARGNTWPLRWAEYDGSPKLAAGASAQLARAFFAGPVASAAAWPLTVSVERAPRVGNVSWRVSQHGTPTPEFVRSSLPKIPTVAATGPIALTLTNPQPSSGLGGIQADLVIQNDRATDLVFRFDPNAQVSAADNLNRPYHVRWAQYDGVVHVAPHATARLARVFFEGPIGDARAAWLTVELRQVPGAQGLKNVVALQ